ncbi:MAG TPA: hypothetical protein PLA67_04325 [Bacillota bacterium]|nr:hypothetical protein [Bacillota bacterium]
MDCGYKQFVCGLNFGGQRWLYKVLAVGCICAWAGQIPRVKYLLEETKIIKGKGG